MRAGVEDVGSGDDTARAGPGRATWLAVVIGVTWLVVYAVLMQLAQRSPTATILVGDWLFLLPAAVAGILCLRAAIRVRRSRRAFWALLTASVVTALVGDALWSLWLLLGRDLEGVFVGDVLYLLASVLLLVTVLVGFAEASRERQVRAFCDAAVVAAGAGTLIWRLTYADRIPESWDSLSVLLFSLTALDLALIVLPISVGLAGHRRVPWSVGLVVLATAAPLVVYNLDEALVADGLLLFGVEAEVLAGQLQYVLLAVAAVLAVDRGEAEPQVRLFEIDLGLGLVLAGVLAALALVVMDLRTAASTGSSPYVGLVVTTVAVVGLVVRLALTIGDQRRIGRRLDTALGEQQRLAVTDGLTGLHNRRFFEAALHLECARSAPGRGGAPVSVIIADLDHFKAVNDTHGHAAGDTVLEAVAQRLRTALRPSDVLARYGGEEFVMLLTGADVDASREVAERVAEALRSTPVPLGTGQAITVTGSLGVATLPLHATTAEDLVRSADHALYSAKAAGRNRVHVAAGPEGNHGPDPHSPAEARTHTGSASAGEVSAVFQGVPTVS